MGTMAAATTEKAGDVHLKFTAWTYADPSKQDEHCKTLAKFLSSTLPRRLAWTWTIRPNKTTLPVAYNREKNTAFTPLELSVSASRTHSFRTMKRTLQIKEDSDAFDVLFRAVFGIMKAKEFEAAANSEVTMVCWFLQKRDEPYAPRMARFVLRVPEKPLSFPAERIEQVLYNLAAVKKDKILGHRDCSGGAVLECIESQLYEQRKANERLISSLDALAFLERQPEPARLAMNSTISQTIEALQSVHANLDALAALYSQHVGRAAPVKGKGKWKIVQTIKNFVRGPLGSVAINNKELEDLKKKVHNELGTLRCTTPILAAHVRLRDGDRRDELQRVCNEAATGPEKTGMTWNLNIMPGNLYDARGQATDMARIRQRYVETYNRVLAEVEAVNKVVGGEYARKGDKLFNIRGRLGRFGKKKLPRERCHVEELQLKAMHSRHRFDEKLF